MNTEQIMALVEAHCKWRKSDVRYPETQATKASLQSAIEALVQERDVAQAALRLEQASVIAWKTGWEKNEAENKVLRDALERGKDCINSLLAMKPVRDADETLAEIDSALKGANHD